MNESDLNSQSSVRERLARVEQAQIHLRAEQNGIRQAIDELTIEIRQQFEGENGRPGLVTRIDRLEQSEARRVRGYWVAMTAALTAFAAALAQLIFGRRA